jgi:hypothetical protein
MGGVRAWAAKRINQAIASLKPPAVALDVLTIRNGDLWAMLTGEDIPRHVQNLDLRLRLGRDYRSLALDIIGAHQRRVRAHLHHHSMPCLRDVLDMMMHGRQSNATCAINLSAGAL